MKSLGMKGDAEGQVASFFCLETDKWRIVAIDTGYNSIGVPILSVIPWINEIPFVGEDCHLERTLIEWLRNVVKLQDNHKSTVILSHHQYFSAFPEHQYPKPAKQLAEFFEKREFVWLWGHEHRLGIYEKATKHGLLRAQHWPWWDARGNGRPDKNKTKALLALYDPRSH